MSNIKKVKRAAFKGISLEEKWKNRQENESYQGSKSGNKFLITVINYRG
jgi:hypothetical protein